MMRSQTSLFVGQSTAPNCVPRSILPICARHGSRLSTTCCCRPSSCCWRVRDMCGLQHCPLPPSLSPPEALDLREHVSATPFSACHRTCVARCTVCVAHACTQGTMLLEALCTVRLCSILHSVCFLFPVVVAVFDPVSWTLCGFSQGRKKRSKRRRLVAVIIIITSGAAGLTSVIRPSAAVSNCCDGCFLSRCFPNQMVFSSLQIASVLLAFKIHGIKCQRGIGSDSSVASTHSRIVDIHSCRISCSTAALQILHLLITVCEERRLGESSKLGIEHVRFDFSPMDAVQCAEERTRMSWVAVYLANVCVGLGFSTGFWFMDVGRRRKGLAGLGNRKGGGKGEA